MKTEKTTEWYQIFLLTFAKRNSYTVNVMYIKHSSSAYLSNPISK